MAAPFTVPDRLLGAQNDVTGTRTPSDRFLGHDMGRAVRGEEPRTVLFSFDSRNRASFPIRSADRIGKIGCETGNPGLCTVGEEEASEGW